MGPKGLYWFRSHLLDRQEVASAERMGERNGSLAIAATEGECDG